MELINSFSVVSYLEGEVAEQIDRIRQTLTPGCPHRAHITILPPRPLYVDREQAISQCRGLLKNSAGFSGRLGEVGIFDSSQVIKIEVAEGAEELSELHRRLNRGPFEQVECFEYTPHVTLCQDAGGERLRECAGEAREQWSGYAGAWYEVHRLTFVQQRADGAWLDFAQFPLLPAVGVGTTLSGAAVRPRVVRPRVC